VEHREVKKEQQLITCILVSFNKIHYKLIFLLSFVAPTRFLMASGNSVGMWFVWLATRWLASYSCLWTTRPGSHQARTGRILSMEELLTVTYIV